jgi:lipopolysaccharide transport system ATP-binding protein
MGPLALRAEGLGKMYVIGHHARRESYTALRDVLSHRATRVLRKARDVIRGRAVIEGEELEELWALKDVSFEVKQGEVVGIIGRNGAGKSTLLKVLSRITEPTTGRVSIHGRVASLLEVGTGFHPELTGRENIYLNGAILGMARAEIKRKFDEIVAFAEVERFLDTPVKRYSSGMYVRLAFAVAAHLEPDILIVDEVLAVGDAAFQQKCLGKMKEVSGRESRTVLLVSHNMGAIMQLASNCIVLSHGSISFSGPPDQAIRHYAHSGEQSGSSWFDLEDVPRSYEGNGAARIVGLGFDRPSAYFTFGEPIRFKLRARAGERYPGRLRVSMTVFAADGTPIGSCFSREVHASMDASATDFLVCLPGSRLAPGAYYCGVAIGTGDHRTGHVDFDVVMDTLYFEVLREEAAHGATAGWARNWGGIVFPDLEIAAMTERAP